MMTPLHYITIQYIERIALTPNLFYNDSRGHQENFLKYCNENLSFAKKGLGLMMKTLGIIECIFLFVGLSTISFSQGSFRHVATLTGDSIGDIFSVVTNVGDTNADGYDDLLVGAYGGNYAKLYLGGPVFDTIPDMVFHCDQPHSEYGYALAGGKDVNGDTYPDFVIGAPYYYYGGIPNGIASSGKAYVFFGGPALDPLSDLEIDCDGWYYHFGCSITLADINGDGHADIIIGAGYDDIDARGRVAIYLGGKEIHTTPDIIIEGQPFDNFGVSVAATGDVNKDGYEDFLIGAPQFYLTGSRFKGGKAYLVYGGQHISLANSTVFVGDSIPPGQFGRVVAGLGDINHDGFSDIGIMGLTKQKIFLGAPSIDTTTSYPLDPLKGFSFIGGIGDINYDGFDDFVSVSDSSRIYLGASPLSKVPVDALPWGHPICRLNNRYSEKHINLVYGVNTYSIGPGKVCVYALAIPDGIKQVPDDILPNQISLYQNYPNPFNGETVIRFFIKKTDHVIVDVYNVLGQQIRILINEPLAVGNHEIQYNANGLPSGMYLYRLKTGQESIYKSMLYIK